MLDSLQEMPQQKQNALMVDQQFEHEAENAELDALAEEVLQDDAVQKRGYASLKSEFIQAITGEHFRLASVTQAKVKLEMLAEQFVQSRSRPAELQKDAVFLWIRDYEVTEEERKQGFKGHFAVIFYKEIAALRGEKPKYTLYATKIPIELKIHPQKGRKKTSHPNWGHPILRAIKKGKSYQNIEAAERDLQLIHEEYPTTTIPLGNKLNVMIYSKLYDSSVKKHVLEIKSTAEGIFTVTIQEREVRTKMPAGIKPKKVAAASTDTASSPQGRFTAMVQLRKNKKK
jgi:hypothetical protein